MKILLVANYSESAGGISGQVTLLKKYLILEGYEVDILSTRGNWIKRLKFFNTIRNIARNYDIIHVHCCSNIGFYPALLGYYAAKSTNRKLILTYHGGGANDFFKSWTSLVKYILGRTDTNIVLSGYLEQIFNKYNIPCVIVPNIIESDFVTIPQKSEIKPNFISIRALEPNYNIECIIKAFEIVKCQIPEAQLDILSDGSCMNNLVSYVNNKKIENVNFLGRVSHTEINQYLRKNDILITMPFVDNQPMTVLEAWNNGLLVISSNVGGIPYLVSDGVTGILVESNNIEELANAMIKAVKYPDNSIDIINNGFQEFKSYSWKNVRSRLINIYSK